MLNGSLPNIMSNHARYNNDVMDNILNPGSVYLTILRDPVTQLETTFNNLGFGGMLQNRIFLSYLILSCKSSEFLMFPIYYDSPFFPSFPSTRKINLTTLRWNYDLNEYTHPVSLQQAVCGWVCFNKHILTSVTLTHPESISCTVSWLTLM